MIDPGTPEMQEREGNDYHESYNSIQNQSQTTYVACAYVGEMGRRCHATQIVAPHLTKTKEMRMWMWVMRMWMWMSRVGMQTNLEQVEGECMMV